MDVRTKAIKAIVPDWKREEMNKINVCLKYFDKNKYIAKYAAMCSIIGSIGVLVFDPQVFIINIIVLIWAILNGYLYLHYSRNIKEKDMKTNEFRIETC